MIVFDTSFDIVTLSFTTCHKVISVKLLICLTEMMQRLHDDDMPLLLCLAWSEEHEAGLDRKQFVLKEIHTDVVEVQCHHFTHVYLLNVLSCNLRKLSTMLH